MSCLHAQPAEASVCARCGVEFDPAYSVADECKLKHKVDLMTDMEDEDEGVAVSCSRCGELFQCSEENQLLQHVECSPFCFKGQHTTDRLCVTPAAVCTRVLTAPTTQRRQGRHAQA